VRLATTSTQATGFTIADAAAPVISAVSAGTPGSTSATITWTTNEASDSQVFWRQAGQTPYQQTAVAPTLVTAHSVAITGLLANTSYEFHVRSADAAGNAAVSTPDTNFTTTVNPFAVLTFEAEAGVLTAPVRVATAIDAFGNRYIDTPSGTPSGTTTSPAGRAVFGVNLPAAGTWRLFVRMYGVANNNNSWFESMDGASRLQIVPSANNVWQWVLASRTYNFAAGLHSLELGGHESQARADRVILTNDPAFTPTEVPQADNTPPAAATGLTGSQFNQTATLNWTNPADPDVARVVVRYRSDGVSPVSPVDGLGLVDRAASPSAAESATHPGLTNGVTYLYSVFVIDAAGNVSDAARVTVSPADTTPPANVQNLRRTDVR
jgi:purple acid phosphatase-like protein